MNIPAIINQKTENRSASIRSGALGMFGAGIGGGIVAVVANGLAYGQITAANILTFSGSLIGVFIAALLVPITENRKWSISRNRNLDLAIRILTEYPSDIREVVRVQPDLSQKYAVSGKIGVILARYEIIYNALELITLDQIADEKAMVSYLNVKYQMKMRIEHLAEYVANIQKGSYAANRYQAEINVVPIDLQSMEDALAHLKRIR